MRGSPSSLHLAHDTAAAVTFTLEVDARGDGSWKKLREITVPPHTNAWTEFLPNEAGAWLRLMATRDTTRATAFFQYRAEDPRTVAAAAIFDGIPEAGDRHIEGGLLHARGGNFKTLRFLARDASGELGCYDLDGELRLRQTNDVAGAAWTAKAVGISEPQLRVDGGAVLYRDPQGKRWRLPRGDAAFDHPGPLGPDRLCREVCTERNLLNVHGTFYELPAENAGGFIKLRPIATHNRRIHDFASYRGLLVLSGLAENAKGERVIRSEDGKCALWLGAIDDLWSFGKPRGSIGTWDNTAVKTGVPGDACLAAGYDRKKLSISHTGRAAVSFRIEADFTGTGRWATVTRLSVPAGQNLEYQFPDAFGAYWLRLIAESDTKATATFTYD